MPVFPIYRSICLILLVALSVAGKLTSTSIEEENMKRERDEIFRQTNLDKGREYWGDRYRHEIDRYRKIFTSNFYSIFDDMGIADAALHCFIYAKNEPDYERWLEELDAFDRAADELNNRDRARYYFAKGMLELQAVPDKIDDIPEEFYMAAENGYDSDFLAKYIGRSSQDSRLYGSRAASVYRKLAESYRRGGYHREAYKFFMLAVKSDPRSPQLMIDAVESAQLAGSEKVAYATALVFINTYTPYGRLNRPRHTRLGDLPVSPAMTVGRLWAGIENRALEPYYPDQTHPAPEEPVDSRELNRFENRYITPLTRLVGSRADLLAVRLSLFYWNDSTIVKRFIPFVNGSIDSHDGAIAAFAEQVRGDPRFNSDHDIATWEARRWREAGKEEEFARRFPQRAALAEE